MPGIYGPTTPADDFVVDSFGVRGPTGPVPLAPLAPWASGLRYTATAPASFVSTAGASYVCLAAHTAGSFPADLAAGLWGLVAGAAPPVPPASAIIFALIFG